MKVWKHLYRCCWNTLLRADWCADSRRRLPQSLKHWVARKHKRSPPESLPTSSPSRANAHHKPIKKKKELNAVNPWTCSPCRSVNKITVRVITSFYAACVSCRAEADNSSVMTHILSQSRCCILPSSPRFSLQRSPHRSSISEDEKGFYFIYVLCKYCTIKSVYYM